jgi:hypothetical protein
VPINTSFVAGGRSVLNEIFIEGGFCLGRTTEAAAGAGFKKVHSIEIDPNRWSMGQNTIKRIGSKTPIDLHLGTSPEVLRQIIDRSKGTTFYLDSHYSGIQGEYIDPVYGECPLIAELKAIFAERWKANPIICIDDSHMFRRPWNADLETRFTKSHWPVREQILKFLPGYDVFDEYNCLYCWPADCATPVWRNPKPPGGVRFTAVVPQGVGDILWVYQKLAPLCGEILFRVMSFGQLKPEIEGRSFKTIRGLPKVSEIDTIALSHYPKVMIEKRRLTDMLDDLRAGVGVYYATNPWLEDGIPLEAIDSDLPVQWDLGVTAVRPMGLPDKYCVLYVSGDTVRHAEMYEKVWNIDEWIELIYLLNESGKIPRGTPIVLVGAKFDSAVIDLLRADLNRIGAPNTVVYDLSLPELLGLFQGCGLFIGYQSGLNMIAAAAGARQFCIYFPRIERMGDSWVRPEHRGTDRMRWSNFDMKPKQVVEYVQSMT